MTLDAVIKQLNVVTGVVAENLELKAQLTQAHQIIGQQQALLTEYEAKEKATTEPAEDGENQEE